MRCLLRVLACLLAVWAAVPGVALADSVAVEAANIRSVFVDSTVEAGGEISLSRVCPAVLSVACLPRAIEVGCDCGMPDMCGLSPCLCGAVDAWGDCACNGTVVEEPALAFESSDESVVRVVEAFGRVWLVPCGAGSAAVTCTASLSHYESASVEFEVAVGFGVGDLALLALVVAAAGGVCLARGRGREAAV